MTVKEPALREIILDILLEVLEKGKYSHVILSQALTKYQYLEKQDRSFIKRVVDGTVEYRIQLDYILNSYSKVKVNKMKPVIRTILRMSAYQICHMDRVPDSAACNEAVKLAEKRGFSGLKGFVNGVLRSISRGKDNLVFPDDSIRYSMPEWLASMWKSTYGEETFRRMMESFLKDRPLMARLCLNRAEKQQILDSLGAQGVTAKDSRYADDVICLEGVDYLEGLEDTGFEFFPGRRCGGDQRRRLRNRCLRRSRRQGTSCGRYPGRHRHGGDTRYQRGKGIAD